MTTAAEDLTWLRTTYDRRASKLEGDHAAGLEYDYELSGAAGAHFTLYVTEETSPIQIAAAKSALRDRRDVTGITVQRIPAQWQLDDEFRPEEYPAPKDGWLEAARQVVRERHCCRVHPETCTVVPDDKRGGILLDLYSASALTRVYDALKPANQAKMLKLALPQAVDVAFSILNQDRAERR